MSLHQPPSSATTKRHFLKTAVASLVVRIVGSGSGQAEEKEIQDPMQLVFNESVDEVKKLALTSKRASLRELRVKFDELLRKKHFDKYGTPAEKTSDTPCDMYLCPLEDLIHGTTCITCEATLLGQEYACRIAIPAGTAMGIDGRERHMSSPEKAETMQIHMRNEYLHYVQEKIFLLLENETELGKVYGKLEKFFAEEKPALKGFGFSMGKRLLLGWNEGAGNKLFVKLDLHDDLAKNVKSFEFNTPLLANK